MKDFTKNTLVFFTSLLLVALALEGILRAFPVRGAFLFPAVNQDNPCFRALPNRKVTFSKAWDFKIPQIKNVNNDGFVNKSDYIASSPLPLISVVGDSYVEAVQITDSEPFFELLKNRLRNFRVYSLGFSGAGLSQYLAWSRYSKEKYKNQYLIINVVGNDFDESLKKYKWQKGHWHYVKDENGMLFLSLCEYKPKRLIYFFLRNSFLANYLLNNIVVTNAFSSLVSFLKNDVVKKDNYVGNISREASKERVQDSYKAIDAFFRDLPNCSALSPDRILFVLDAMRKSAYNPLLLEKEMYSYYGKMKSYFTEKALQLGYEVLDLQVPFQEHYAEYGKHFEFPFDAHWNALGHQVVADSIEKTLFWSQIKSTKYQGELLN